MPEYTLVQRDCAKYRLDKSKEDLEAAKLLFEGENERLYGDNSSGKQYVRKSFVR